MLLRFEAQNFLSLRDVTELSLVASSLKDNPEPILDVPPSLGIRVLSGALIYGANASGKSNIVSAIGRMRSFVLYSHSHGAPEGKINRRPFALDASCAQRPTMFEVDIVLEGVRYNYGFEITDDSVSSEWLHAFPNNRQQILFKRDFQNFSFGRNLRGRIQTIAELTRGNSLFLSAAAQNDHKDILPIYRFFDDIVINSSIDVGGHVASLQWGDQNEVDARIIGFLNASGTGVVDFRKREEEYPEKSKDFNRKFYELMRTSYGFDPDNLGFIDTEKKTQIQLAHLDNNGSNVFFDLDRESSGTRRLLVLLAPIFLALDRGGLIVIDELDASLHTKACEAILALFSSKLTNPHGAQLVATTHDTNILSSKLIRRDQVWFVEKSNKGETILFPLTDIRTRESDNVEKGYLQGRFGAIPFSGSPSDFFKDMINK